MHIQKQLLTNGNIFKRTDGRWNGVVWYMDEQGERKSFSGTSCLEVPEKLTASDESKAKLPNWATISVNSLSTIPGADQKTSPPPLAPAFLPTGDKSNILSAYRNLCL